MDAGKSVRYCQGHRKGGGPCPSNQIKEREKRERGEEERKKEKKEKEESKEKERENFIITEFKYV